MSCKIMDGDAPVEALRWRPVASKPAAAVSVAKVDEDTGRLQARIAELERLRNTDLANCRAAAFKEGLEKGRGETGQVAREASDRLARLTDELHRLRSEIRKSAEEDLVKLSLAIARRILHRELATDPESIAGVVHAALQHLENRQITLIRTGPSAVASVQAALELANVAPAISVQADASMGPGDLIFETALGELNASVNTQLREIERGFADRLGLL